MAGLARALKHGPRRSFGKSRHNETDPSPPKFAPVTKPKPKVGSKGGSDEKEEKSGGFLFRRRSFNDKKTTGDDDSFKGSPKVSKKFGLKIGGSANKKPPVKSKPVFSSTSTGENDSILSEDIPQVNNSTPSKTYEPKRKESPVIQKTSTPYKEEGTPPSRRERTPNERDSSLFKDPPSLFGHRSVLFGSTEFDAIFEKYSKEDEETSKAAEPTGDDSEDKRHSEKPTPERKPTPLKKPEITAKPKWTPRGSTSSEKSSEQKSVGSRVSEGRALFERPKSPEEDTTPKRGSGRRGFGGIFSKYEDNARTMEAKKSEEQTTGVKSKEEKQQHTEVKKEEKVEESKEDAKMEVTKVEDGPSSTKPSLFDDDRKAEAMETEESETKVGNKTSLFDKYEAESTTTNLFKDVGDDDGLFGEKDKKETAASAKKTVYDSLFSTEERVPSVKKTGSLFDEENSDDDDQLFKTTKKPQNESLGLTKSPDTAATDKEIKVSSLLTDEDESPLFGKPKSPVLDLFSKEKEEKEEKAVEDDTPMDIDKDKTESEVKHEKEDDSPGLFDKPSSPLFESGVQRSTSIFEGKRSKSEEDLFQIDEKGKDSEMKETDVAGGYLLVDVEKKKDEATRSSLFDDDKLVFDDSDVLPKLEKDSKEKKRLFEIDDFVMVDKQEESTTESLSVEDSTVDPLSDGKEEKSSEVALEEFPPKQSVTEEKPQDEASKESVKEKDVPADLDKSRTRHKSAEKKKDTSSKEEKKSSTDDKPAWMIEAQRRKERRLLEKEKEKEKKLQAAKGSPSSKRTTEQSKPPLIDVKLKKSNISTTTTSVAKKPVVEDDMPEWQKKLMERKQRVAEQKKTMLSSSSRETTYTSRRERQKDTATTMVTAASSSVEDKKKEDDIVKDKDRKVEEVEEKEQKDDKVEEKEQKDDKVEKEQKDDKVEEKEQKETEELSKTKTTDEEKEKSKSPLPSPLPEKPLLSPKPKLDEVKSPARTTSVSNSKPELRKKPSVEVTISSTKRETRRPSAEREKDKDSSKSPVRELDNETEKVSPSSKRRIASTSDKKTVSVSSKVSTSVSSTRSASTSSDSGVPKWKRELQQKKAEPEKKEKGARDTVVSPTQQDTIPDWKRQLLEKRKQRRTPTPTEDKEVRQQRK